MDAPSTPTPPCVCSSSFFRAHALRALCELCSVCRGAVPALSPPARKQIIEPPREVLSLQMPMMRKAIWPFLVHDGGCRKRLAEAEVLHVRGCRAGPDRERNPQLLNERLYLRLCAFVIGGGTNHDHAARA